MEARKSDSIEDSMSLLSLNHLSYESPSSITACSQRTPSQINFQPRSYANLTGSEQASIVFNTGSAYVLGQTSTINIKMNLTSGVALTGTNPAFFAFGNNVVANNETYVNSGGSVINLFSEVSHNARSGELLYRELFANQVKAGTRNYRINKERRGQLGMMGAAGVTLTGDTKYPLYSLNQDVSFTIPLCELASFFNTAAPIPPQLLSGSTLRLSIAKLSQVITLYTVAGDAIATTNTAQVTVNITEMTSFLDQVEMFDSVNSLVLSASSSLENNGLQYSYNTVFNAIYPVESSGNIDVQLSAAKISSIVLKFVPRVLPDWNSAGNYTDPMAAASIRRLAAATSGDANSLSGIGFRVRLGNQIIPLYQIKTATESYLRVCDALSNISFASCEDPDSLKTLNKLSPCAIQYSDYVRSVGALNGYGTGATIFGLTFERSNCLNISGLSSNNARVLSVEYEGLTAGAFNMIVSVQYIAIANCSTSNVVVNK